ncbi:MAG: hypothetical protein H7177_17445 [Rhizobacter sp.]|nr:hypothetical protein [Bacteriovorax sp.]
MNTLLKLIILTLLILPLTGRAELRDDVNFYSSVLGGINSPKKTYVCNALVHEQKNCSNLFNIFERDQSTGLFFGMISDSPWDTCKKYISSGGEISTNELEKKLSAGGRTALGLRNDYFSSKMAECLPQKKNSNTVTQSKIIVTMGYDYLNRLKKSTGQMADEIKKLNSIVGDPIDSALPCGEFSMPHDAKICQDIKNDRCKPLNELGKYTDSLFENAIEPMIALKAAQKSLIEKFIKTRTLYRPENREILKDLDNKIKSLENQFPILKGKSLGPFLASETYGGKTPERSKLMAAVKAQLLQNRENLSKKLNENIDMNNCIVYGDDSYCKNFKENFARMPPREDVNFFTKGSTPAENLKNRAASELYGTNQCLDNFRELKSEYNSFAADFSINVGLTILTGGTGLLIRAGGTGVKLAMAGQKAMMLADAAFLGVGIEEAVKTCSTELNKLEKISSGATATTTNSCPVSLAAPENVVMANYQGCITGAMLASLNALPFVPAAVSKYLARVKTPKASGEAASELSALLKFKAPKKAFDPHDLKSVGTIFPPGKMQEASAVFKRDGVYVYIIDSKGNMVLSHRTPDLSAGVKEGDQFLGTHRGLFNKLSETGDAVVVAAGEIRVVGGVPVRVSPRAGSFHNTPEEVLANMKQFSTVEEKSMIDKILEEYRKISPEDRKNSMMVEMHIEDFLDATPGAKAVYEKMQKQLAELADKRLATAREGLESRGLVPKDGETKFVRDVGGDAHLEGRDAAIAEINCSKNKNCSNQMDAYQQLARKFIQKFKTPEKSELAVVEKMSSKDLKGLSQKEKAFQFFNQRSYLLFKEGPIEFIQNAHPEKFGLTADEALKYMKEWSNQF